MHKSRAWALGIGLFVTFGLIGGLVWVATQEGAGDPTPLAASPESGLEISNVTVHEGKADISSDDGLRYDLSWTGESFPGIHRCTWEMLNTDGKIVNRFEDVVVSLRPRVIDAKLDLDAPSDATQGRGACDSERLDVGDPYEYEFGNVSAEVRQEGLATVWFEANWLGKGLPGAVTCEFQVRDEAGTLLASSNVNLVVSSRSASDETIQSVEVPGASAGDPVVGAVESCRPFSA